MISKIHHSTLESFHHLLINKTIISIVKNNNINENEVSCSKCAIQLQSPEESKQTGDSVIGVIVALIPIIPSVLKIFDPTKFPTHISYLFFKTAVTVVANSGKLVHAAIIVAHIAHCDIPKCSAINTAASTTVSEAKTKSQRLATSFVTFSSIIFDHFFLLCSIDSTKSIANTHINIALKVHNPNEISKAQFAESMCITDKITVQTKRYTKFFISGKEISLSSSVGASFFIHKYALYHTKRHSKSIQFRLYICPSRSIQNINPVISNKNSQSL